MKQTEDAKNITFDLLEQMIQTRFEGTTTTLKQTLENALQVLVAAVSRHSKGGSMTLKINLSPEDDGQIDIFADVDVNPPRPKPLPVRLFGTKRGDLYPHDPEMVVPSGMFGQPTVAVDNTKEAK